MPILERKIGQAVDLLICDLERLSSDEGFSLCLEIPVDKS